MGEPTALGATPNGKISIANLVANVKVFARMMDRSRAVICYCIALVDCRG